MNAGFASQRSGVQIPLGPPKIMRARIGINTPFASAHNSNYIFVYIFTSEMIYEHIGLTVSDLETSINFYIDVFGFRLLRRTETSAYLHLGTDLLELTQVRGHTCSRDEMKDPAETMYNSIGITHIGFRIDNLDDAIEKIEESGGKLVISPFTFMPKITYVTEHKDEKLRRASTPQGSDEWRIAGFSDPDGIILEIIER